MHKVIRVTLFTLQCLGFVSSTNRPIVGVLAQENLPKSGLAKYGLGESYIITPYVKALEASGARVVPIFINKEYSYYWNLLNSINGVLIPGGNAALSPGNGYYDALTTIYDIAKKLNDNNNYFPLFAICLGFEGILIRANNHDNLQTRCNVFHENLPLLFRPKYRESLLYSGLPSQIEVYLKYIPVTKNNHAWCITPKNFSKSSLPSEWSVTSDNVSKRGLRFISGVEHKKYPFVGILFHPEKYFVWTEQHNNPHSKIGIMANRYFYDFFVGQTKFNYNKFVNSSHEFKSIINNYNTVYAEQFANEIGANEAYSFD